MAYLASRPLLTALNATMLALGVATITFLLLVTQQAEERLARDAKPVDLVVGAKGSPLQLILSTVFHADVPTGNIGVEEAEAIVANPMVASATPLALGDSFRGYRIVGTDASFLGLYEAKVAQGALFAGAMEAVVGAEVARRQAVTVGASITGSHGLAAAGPAHGEHPYRVTGILAPTGAVIDRLVVTSVESVWHVHERHATARPEITALLIRYATPLAAAMLPRSINATTAMQAASPAYEIARLLELVGAGVETLRWFAIILMASAALSLFVALTSALQERRYDLALLRTLGARPASLAALTLVEGVTLLMAGVILGLALGHGATHVLGLWLARSGSWPLTGLTWVAGEAVLAAAVLAIGALTCLVPAIQAYFTDPANLLSKR
ncbi:MAG: ABC transporter permease [Betaproteobacteria bacterium]|nr:ABC transporter permease [Betaproteobacteria bacterium]